MSTLRELKGRISGVASTGKTTNAMKMISSAKMHKAEIATRKLLPYRDMVQSVLGHLLCTDSTFSSPLIEVREAKRVALVVFGSDDGLCGAYNINIFKQLIQALNDCRAKYGNTTQVIIYPVGKKIARAAKKLCDHLTSVEVVEYASTRSTANEVSTFAQLLQGKFLDHSVDVVELLYMHYITAGRQVFTRSQLLPVSPEAIANSGKKSDANSPCLFEPDANSIFNAVLPLHIISTMQDVFTENVASENAARVMAMQAASDNAKTLLEALQLEYNKLRQQGITTELLDILGGQVER